MVSMTSKTMIMFLKLAKECCNQPCLGEEGGGCRTVTQPGGQACGGHLQEGFLPYISYSMKKVFIHWEHGESFKKEKTTKKI